MLRCAPSVPTAQHGLFTRSVITQGLHVSFLHSLFFVCPFVCTLFVHFIAHGFPRLLELWMLVTKATTQGLYFDWFHSLFLFVHLFVEQKPLRRLHEWNISDFSPLPPLRTPAPPPGEILFRFYFGSEVGFSSKLHPARKVPRLIL